MPKGGSTIIDIDGKPVFGAPPKKGRRIEVKYSVVDGDNIAVSMRYVPLDYVLQPAASTVPLGASSETTTPVQKTTNQAGDIFEGKVESVTKMLPRPPSWRFGILRIVAASGEKRDIDIMDSTVVTDSSGKETGKARNAWGLRNGQSVEVRYWPAANCGHDKAVSIRCLD